MAGCEVQAAILRGELSPEELESYRQLRDESLRQQARHDAYSRHLLNQKHKRFAKMVRGVVKAKSGQK